MCAIRVSNLIVTPTVFAPDGNAAVRTVDLSR